MATKGLVRWTVAAGVALDKAEAKTDDGKFLVYYSMSYVG